jgi:hypothetical protein
MPKQHLPSLPLFFYATCLHLPLLRLRHTYPILVIRRILKIINSKPTVTITSRTKPNQPSTIAEVFFTRLVYTYLFFAYDILTLITGRHKWEMNNIYAALRINCDYSSSVILVIRRILKIINSKPTVTITSTCLHLPLLRLRHTYPYNGTTQMGNE